MDEKNQQKSEPQPASPQNTLPIPKKFPTPGDVFAMLGIILCVQIVISVIFRIVLSLVDGGADAAMQEPRMLGRQMAVIYLVTMTLALLGVLRYRKVRGGSGPVVHFSAQGLNPVLLVWAFVLMLAAGVVIEPVVSLLPAPPYENMGRGFWTIVSVAVFAPLFEEVLCRGVVMGALCEKYGAAVALLVSSLFFGVLHVYPASVVGAFVLGLVLGYVYLVTRSLWAPIILHAANNAVAYVLMVSGYGDKNLEEIVSRSQYMVIYMLSLVVAVVSAYMVWKSLSRMKEAEKNSPEA